MSTPILVWGIHEIEIHKEKGEDVMRKRKLRWHGIIGLVAMLAFIMAGCGGGGEVTSTPTPVDHTAAGKQLFIDKGCATCHGQNSEGTNIAPALAGHNKEQVQSQVRRPLGSMPRSDRERISDDELEKIADYIVSLEYDAGHVEPVDIPEELVMHHWMALNALGTDNPDEAEHHIGHIITIVTDAEHESRMQTILEDARAGRDHDAEHALEEMLVTKAKPGLEVKRMHLQLALTSIGGHNLADARHHVEHFIALVTGDEKAAAEEVIDLLEQGNTHDAEHEVEELLE